ncbi:phage head closure protein [Shewanella sp. LC6]|uniref:phage head closure protein n=1 Tax=unclassified Shewanella TaxID=196818 RepID=UPI0011299E3A|nr:MULTISPECIES: phage head closure protein [unclassified Shewanella]QQK59715.1 phage head closure protein [Shewanella sp. LC6]TPE56682.1 head-tail adaptor protein [Shewanella sp. LC2]
MASGKLRHRIDVFTSQKQQDPLTGEMKKNWVPAFKTMADFMPLSVKDFIAASAAQSQISGKFEIHFRPEFPSEFRIRHAGKVYKPEGVLPDIKSGHQRIIIPVSETNDVLVG